MTSFRENLSRWILIAVILLSPYYRGLYPDYYKLPFISLLFLAFLSFHILLSRQKETFVQIKPPVTIFLIFTLIYLFSALTAASKGSALIIFLSYTAWVVLFWMVIDLFQKESMRFILMALIVFNSALLSFLSFLGALNLIPASLQNLFGMSFWGFYFYGRVSTSFQYQNTSASFLASSLFLGIFLFVQEKVIWKKIIFGMINYLIFSGFLFAFSRGANLFFLVSLVFLFMVVRNFEEKIEIGLFLSALFCPLVLFQTKLDRMLVLSKPISFWFFYGVGFVLFLGVLSLFVYYKRTIKDFLKRKYFILFLVFILGLESCFLFFLPFDFEYGISTRYFVEKGREMSFQSTNAVNRIAFYRDALKMAWRRPLLGWGGGSWAAHYFSYQSYTYYTKFPHSFYLNTLIESGILGLSILLILLFYCFRLFMTQIGISSRSTMTPFLGTAAFMIFFHSGIDLNFAMGAYHIFAWTILALLLSTFSIPDRSLRVPLKLTFSLTLLFFILSILWGNAEYYYQLGNKLQADKEYVKSAQAWELAARFNPFHDEAQFKLSVLARELYMQSGRIEFLNISEEKNQKAIALEPYNYEYFRQKGDLFLLKSELDEAWKEYIISMELAPMVIGNYEKILFSYHQFIESLKNSENNEVLKRAYNNTQETYSQFLTNQEKSSIAIPPSEAMMSLLDDLKKIAGGEK